MLKFMKKRKILALVLALALTLGLAAPAMAADPAPTPTVSSDGKSEVTVKVMMNLPTINVTIGAAPSLIVNPYQLKYNVDNIGDTWPETDSIISAPVLITSRSSIDLNVTAAPAGTIEGGDVTFAESSAASSPTKSVFLFLELKEVNSANTTAANLGVTWSTGFTSAADQALVKLSPGPTEAGTKATYKLPAITDPDSPKYCGFKLIGDCSTNPSTSWTRADKIGVTIAFTFTPVKPTPATPGP